MKVLIILLLLLCLTPGKAFSRQESGKRPTTTNYVKGVEALNAGDAETAYKYLNAEIHQSPGNGYAHCYMALVCNYFGNPSLALQAADTSLRLLPASDTEYVAFAHYVKGMLCFGGNAPAKALADLNEAVRLAPADSEYRKLRAQVLLAQGEGEAAFADLSAVLQKGEDPEADELVDQLAEIVPTEQMLQRIASCYAQAGQPSSALKYVEMALLLAPSNARLYALRADAEYECGLYGKALASYRKACRMDADAAAQCRMLIHLQKLDKEKEAMPLAHR